MRKLILPLVLGCSLASAPLLADSLSDKVAAAMKSEQRSDKDKARDKNRKPVETLAFFGIRDNMKVLELIPGGGWYTQLLAPALRDKGELFVAIGTRRISDKLLKQPGFDKVKVLSPDTAFQRNVEKKAFDLNEIKFGRSDMDAVLTFRNYHNFTKESRMAMNDAAFKALKPGGIYGVVDHTRRHMQQRNNENGRRVDPVLAIKEILEAGFEFVDYSTLHYRPDDELRYEVGRKTVTGNTDRFTLRFRKPAK